MRQIMIGTSTLFMIYFVSYALGSYQDPLFEDPFNTSTQWVSATGTNDFTGVVGEGVYTVTASTKNQAFLRHNFQAGQKVENFSYTVKMNIKTENKNGCGVLFCLQSDVMGYMFIVYGSRQYALIKYIKDGPSSLKPVTLTSGLNSFIYPGDNILSISKKGSEISILCNNVLFEKVTDAEYASGDIGLCVGTTESVAFDNALYSATLINSQPKEYYADAFDDNNLSGWMRLDVSPDFGNWKCEKGVASVSTAAQEILFTSGLYNAKACTTIVTNTQSTQSSFYGITYLSIELGKQPKSFNFLISGSRMYVVSTEGTMTPQSHSAIHGTTDTLIVTANAALLVNGQAVDTLQSTQPPVFNAVGFMTLPTKTDDKVVVSFDNFRVGTPPGTPITVKPFVIQKNQSKQSYILGGCGIVVDMKGRKVASFNGNDVSTASLNNLGAGPYYIIQRDKKEYFVRKAIINLQK
ncbi:MAG: hypothetical protein JW795_21260 [Chitinivibrionales bacterium]|nr:hypothetical protein [Chitinivibrionales bacterium]